MEELIENLRNHFATSMSQSPRIEEIHRILNCVREVLKFHDQLNVTNRSAIEDEVKAELKSDSENALLALLMEFIHASNGE